MTSRTLSRFGLLIGLLACLGCERDPEKSRDPQAALTPFQRTAIEMCNQGSRRLQEYHQLAKRAGNRKIYVGLSSTPLAKTIQTYTKDNRSSTFREFVNQFANDEASFVWENRANSPTILARKHLDWCREQDDWVSSYR